MRRTIALIAGIVVLVAVNWSIHGRERLLETGRVVLLELVPVDPRSLMQGDYMQLHYQVADEAFGRRPGGELADGHLVVKIGDHGVARFVRHGDRTPLAADEVLLRFRVRGGRVKFATNAYFFQEGTAQLYEQARYGEFRVAPDGEMLLTHLVGEKFERLGEPQR